MIRQGDIYLVNFAKKYNSEFGKIRPAVILQNDFLNRALAISTFQSVLLVPLTTRDIETEYKIEIPARDRLEERSFVVTNWLCTLDLKRILTDKGLLTRLTEAEMTLLRSKINDLM